MDPDSLKIAELNSIYRAAPVGIGMVVNRVIQEANDTLSLMTGYTREELIGQSARLLYPTDEDYEYVGREKYRQIAERGTGAVETRWQRKDGQIIHVLLSSTALDPADLTRGVVFTALDITDRKRASGELRASEQRFHDLFQNMPACCFTYDRNGVIQDWNRACENLYGWTAEQAVGKSMYELFVQEKNVARTRQNIAAVFEGQSFEGLEFEDVCADGSLCTVLSNEYPLRDSSGQISLGICVELDITDRKRAEAAQREQEAQVMRQKDVLLGLMLRGTLFRADLPVALAEITEACSEIIGTERVSVWLYNEDHSMIHCLDLYERSKGRHSAGEELLSADFPSYTQSHLRGEVITAVDVRTDPRTREIPAAYWDAHNIYSLMDAPVWQHGKVGGLVSFEQVGAPRAWTLEDERFAASIATLVSLCFESAELQRVNRFLDSIVENIPDMIFLKEAGELRFVRVNRAGENLLGLSREEMLGKNDYDFFPKEQADFFIQKDRETLQGKTTVEIPEETIQTRHLGPRVLHTKKVPILGAGGEPEYLLGISEDITERKQAQQRAFELALERERVEILSRFIQDASHEFRTPLAIIQSNVYLAERLEDPNKRHYKLAQIGEQVAGITRLVDLLSEIARLDSSLPFTTAPADINELIVIETTKLQDAAAAKRLTVHLDPAPELPRVQANLFHLGRALRELLDNAVRFTPPGGCVIVRTRSADDGVMVEIQDNGPGIPADVLPHIFERFYRQDMAHTTPGFGLGLPIARAAIERHGGKIWVSSTPGQGATFYVKLPVVKSQRREE